MSVEPAGMTAARKPAKTLSAVFVRSVRAPGKYFDGHGLFLRVEDGGSKRWVQRIVIRGKRREIGLGSADLIPLAQARQTALDNRRLARQGGDPLQAKRDAAAVLTFEEAARKVHALHLPTWRNTKHAAQFISTLETYAFPHFGKLRVADVTTGDVLAALMPIWTDKPETARRVRQRIGAVMKWAIAQGWRQDNPAESISRALPKHDRLSVQNRKALPYGKVAGAVRKVQASGAGLSTKLCFEFLVLTAARSGEARGALWSEVDLDRAEWSIPAERMKAKRLHRVPLAPRAVEILRQAEALSDGSGLVFPGTKAGRPLSDMTLSKLLKELEIDAHVHGFRTSFKTWAQEQTSFANEISEAALAHVLKDKAEAAYARSDLFEKRQVIASAWAAYIKTQKTNE